MPYIAQEDRPELDPAIEKLVDAVRERASEREGTFEGYLNYALTRLVLGVLPSAVTHRSPASTGVLENVKQEFYRRYAAPYEDEQIDKSGDVY